MFFAVMYRSKDEDGNLFPWDFAGYTTPPNSYENCPDLYQTRERAERRVAELLKDGAGYIAETRVVEVPIPPPEA